MDLHNSYRMQQCATGIIADIPVVMEQGILKIYIFKTAVYIGGKKTVWKRTTQHLFWKSALIKQTLKDHALIENEVYQMMIEKKEKQTTMSENSVEISFAVHQLSANSVRYYFVVYRYFHINWSQS